MREKKAGKVKTIPVKNKQTAAKKKLYYAIHISLQQIVSEKV